METTFTEGVGSTGGFMLCWLSEYILIVPFAYQLQSGLNE
jgi:hypothetical protein